MKKKQKTMSQKTLSKYLKKIDDYLRSTGVTAAMAAFERADMLFRSDLKDYLEFENNLANDLLCKSYDPRLMNPCRDFFYEKFGKTPLDNEPAIVQIYRKLWLIDFDIYYNYKNRKFTTEEDIKRGQIEESKLIDVYTAYDSALNIYDHWLKAELCFTSIYLGTHTEFIRRFGPFPL